MNSPQGTQTCTCTPTELQKQQLDYAWKWFSFHADQRTKVFNFMLVTMALVTAAIGTVLDKGIDPLALRLLCGFGVALAFAFVLLDCRNRELVWIGENLLTHLEKTVLFPDRTPQDARYAIANATGRTDSFVLGAVSSDAHANGFAASWTTDPLAALLRGKHRVMFPAIALMFALLFVVMGWKLEPVGKPAPSAAALPSSAAPAASAPAR